MMRHCDGSDVWLLDALHEPCTCGARFDDVRFSAIYPHARIPDPAERQRLMQTLGEHLDVAATRLPAGLADCESVVTWAQGQTLPWDEPGPPSFADIKASMALVADAVAQVGPRWTLEVGVALWLILDRVPASGESMLLPGGEAIARMLSSVPVRQNAELAPFGWRRVTADGIVVGEGDGSAEIFGRPVTHVVVDPVDNVLLVAMEGDL